MTSSPSNSYTTCSTFCAGFPYFGVEYSNECYCAWVLPSGPSLRADTECNMPCSGAPTSSCGGPNRITVFASTAAIDIPTNPRIPAYGYKGCYTDDVYARVLTGSVLRDDAMTVERCAAACAGSYYFGTQFGRECYCGESLVGDTRVVDQGECAMQCGGDGMEFCGANARLSLYESMEHVNGTASGDLEGGQ